jgi:hypothetical protein
MSFRKQNVLSIIAIVVLVALNTLPAGDPQPGAGRTVVAHR